MTATSRSNARADLPPDPVLLSFYRGPVDVERIGGEPVRPNQHELHPHRLQSQPEPLRVARASGDGLVVQEIWSRPTRAASNSCTAAPNRVSTAR